MAEFTPIWREMPKFVFSRTLDRAELELLETRRFGNGVVLLRYRPVPRC